MTVALYFFALKTVLLAKEQNPLYMTFLVRRRGDAGHESAMSRAPDCGDSVPLLKGGNPRNNGCADNILIFLLFSHIFPVARAYYV